MFGVGVEIIISCLVASIASSVIPENETVTDRSHRIIGGKSVGINERPYMVQLRESSYGLFRCGGVLVTPIHVITAAHCLKDTDRPVDIVVVGGSNTIFDAGVQRSIDALNIHPEYGRGHQYANDVAVLKLASPLKGDNITESYISYDGVPDGEFFTISGWGRTEEGMTGVVPDIRTARVKKLSAQDCEKKYSTYKGVTDSMICAADTGKDSCAGDSGGPVVYHNRTVAIVSWGKGCADPDYPGVYTSLKSVQDFVSEKLK